MPSPKIDAIDIADALVDLLDHKSTTILGKPLFFFAGVSSTNDQKIVLEAIEWEDDSDKSAEGHEYSITIRKTRKPKA